LIEPENIDFSSPTSMDNQRKWMLDTTRGSSNEPVAKKIPGQVELIHFVIAVLSNRET